MITGLQGLFDSGDPYDRSVWTPWSIEAFAKQTNTEFLSVTRSFDAAHAAGVIDADLLADFNTFYNEWATYHDSMGAESYFPLVGAYWWGDTVKQIKAFRERLDAWAQKLVPLGYGPSEPRPGAAGPRGDQTNIIGQLTTLAWVVGLGYVGYKVLNETPLLSALGGKIRKATR